MTQLAPHLIVDLAGAVTTRPPTVAEQTASDGAEVAIAETQAAEQAVETADATERTNFPTLRQQLDDAQAQLQAVIDDSNVTNAEAVAAIKLLCRLQLVQIRLWRHVITRGIRQGWL